MATTTPRFKAFISYSHAADGKLAPALQSSLQSFAKPWHVRRACRVFRDQTTLSPTSALWPAIEGALLDSEFFILLASPRAAGSEWVGREVETWCSERDPQKLIIVLTEGDIVWSNGEADFDWSRTTALPPSLSKKLAQEPYFHDLRWAHTGEQVSPRDPRFLDVVATLSSALRGISKDDVIGQDVREHRRTQRVVRATIALLLVLTAVATTASVLATVARRLAENRRVQARSVAESIIFEIDGRLSGLPEAAGARESLGEKARGLLEMLGDDVPDQQKTRALMVQHTQKAEEAAAHGNTALARTELEKSLAFAQKLRGLDAMKSEFIRDVSVCLNKLGDLLTQSHDYEGARRYLDQDIALNLELLERAPSDPRLRNDMAISLEKIGNVCLALGDVRCARASLEEDLKIMRDLHAQFPTNDDITRGFAVALVQAGEMMFQTHQLKRASEVFQEAVTAHGDLHAKAPQDARISRDLWVALLKLGDVQIQLRKPNDALGNFDEAVRIRRALLARAPTDPAMQRDLAVVLGRVASARFQNERVADGLAPMLETITLFTALADAPGSTDEAHRELAINLYDLAGAEARLDLYTHARDHLTKCIALLRNVKFQAPTSAPNDELFQALRRAGLVELALHGSEQAREFHTEACNLAATIPFDALGEEGLTSLVFDLAQIAEEQAASKWGSADVATRCASLAMERFEQLRTRNADAANDKELAATTGRLRTLTAASGRTPD